MKSIEMKYIDSPQIWLTSWELTSSSWSKLAQAWIFQPWALGGQASTRPTSWTSWKEARRCRRRRRQSQMSTRHRPFYLPIILQNFQKILDNYLIIQILKKSILLSTKPFSENENNSLSNFGKKNSMIFTK